MSSDGPAATPTRPGPSPEDLSRAPETACRTCLAKCRTLALLTPRRLCASKGPRTQVAQTCGCRSPPVSREYKSSPRRMRISRPDATRWRGARLGWEGACRGRDEQGCSSRSPHGWVHGVPGRPPPTQASRLRWNSKMYVQLMRRPLRTDAVQSPRPHQGVAARQLPLIEIRMPELNRNSEHHCAEIEPST